MIITVHGYDGLSHVYLCICKRGLRKMSNPDRFAGPDVGKTALVVISDVVQPRE